ncbi:MAG: ABC transporter permease [Anaerolineales bacterium]|nr:ABC transporter permease [Anaerolineales bacterium]
MSFYLAFKEMWRNKGRFFLFSLVIALITILVLFIAALAQGLALANKEYIEKLNADLIVFQEKVELSTSTSRVGLDKLNNLRRVPGVADVGPIGFSSGSLVFADGQEALDVALVGVQPGKPGMPPVYNGNSFRSDRGYYAVLDGSIASRNEVKVGDEITIKTIVGSEDKFYQFQVVGVTDGRQYLYQPSVFMPLQTWEKIRPQASIEGQNQSDLVSNVMAIKLTDPENWEAMAKTIESQVSGIEVVDRKTAYQSSPGYSAQQSTLNTQQGFTLLIGILVIGGFFQIQTLQKVPQIGMLKAIGANNKIVALTVIMQIILVTFIGVALGSIGTFLLTLGLPGSVPITLTGSTAILTIATLLLIGPIGGLVSVRLAIKVEPLTALGM